MSQTQKVASHAARLLGARAPDSEARADGQTLLAAQVATALGVQRPAGERTLNATDNLPLRILLEERRLLGTEVNADAIERALREGSLILAAFGAPGSAQSGQVRGMTMVLSPRGEGEPLCVFTHDAALRAHVGSAEVTAWVTEAPKVWQFAVHVLRRTAVIDPGCSTELSIDAGRLQRLVAAIA